jgi:hypothetical protein
VQQETPLYLENLKDRGHLGDVGMDWRILLKLMFKAIDCEFVDCM